DGEVRHRARRLAGQLGPATLVVAGGFLAATVAVTGSARAAVPAVVAGVALLGGVAAIRLGREGWAFAGTAVAIGLAVATLFAGTFPVLLPSTLDPAFSLTASNAAASAYPLRIMTGVALVFLPLVIGYQAWTYW